MKTRYAVAGLALLLLLFHWVPAWDRRRQIEADLQNIEAESLQYQQEVKQWPELHRRATALPSVGLDDQTVLSQVPRAKGLQLSLRLDKETHEVRVALAGPARQVLGWLGKVLSGRRRVVVLGLELRSFTGGQMQGQARLVGLLAR